MTPEQKIKHAILNLAARYEGNEPLAATAENIDVLYDELVEHDGHWDAKEEIRNGTHRTELPCDFSRNYESESVAAQMPDGSWVGWTYWYGGGKYGEPSAVDWMEGAYDLDHKEEEQIVIVHTFTKREEDLPADAGAVA